MKRILIYILSVLLLSFTSCKKISKWFGKSSLTGNEVATLILEKQELENRIKTDSANYEREMEALRIEYEQKLSQFEKGNQKPAKGFFVIVGSFKNMQLAEKFSSKIKSLGYDGNIVKGNGSYAFITAGSFGSLKEALPALKNARSLVNPEAWIYFK